MSIIKGNTRREKLENLSYLIIILSAVMIFFGILLGSFIKYTVFVGSIGAFSIIIGITIYIISQFIE